jgi:hypothetical protein
VAGQFGGYIVARPLTTPQSIGSGAILSGNVASGQVGQAALSSGALQSGQLGSGVLSPASRNLVWDLYTAGETLSGFCPVAIISGGVLGRAQGGSGLRMPAIGVALANYASGAAAPFCGWGQVNVTSGLDALWSGSVGKVLWVSTSGDLMTPTQPIVATLSQGIGLSLSGGLFVTPDLTLTSGGAAIQSGLL